MNPLVGIVMGSDSDWPVMQAAAEMLKEDMETRGPVKVSDVEKAQQNILKVCRKLEEEGRIVIGGGGGEELL